MLLQALEEIDQDGGSLTFDSDLELMGDGPEPAADTELPELDD